MSKSTASSNNTQWVMVKIVRWENGHGTSSGANPVELDASANRFDLNAVYKTIWDHFTTLERDADPLDRRNVPLGAGPRASDGIERLCVSWQGSNPDWSVHDETTITERNLRGIWHKLLKAPTALIYCTIKDNKLPGLAWTPQGTRPLW